MQAYSYRLAALNCSKASSNDDINVHEVLMKNFLLSSLTVAQPEVAPTIDDDFDMKGKVSENKVGYGKRHKFKQWSRRGLCVNP